MFKRLFIALLLTVSCLQAKVIHTATYTDLFPLVDKDTLFLVDLDNTLFEAAQALGHANWFYDEVNQKMEQGLSKNQAMESFYPEWVRIQHFCPVQPLEKGFISYLQSLQGKGVSVMGLTHRQPIIADVTKQQVNSLGINFLKTAPNHEVFSLEAEYPTLYRDGILFVGDYNSKFDIFEKFLAATELSPKKIVFIDDKRKNVDELEALIRYGIEYIGVHYTACDNVKPVYDRALADCQLKYLNQILSNEAAELLIENGLN